MPEYFLHGLPKNQVVLSEYYMYAFLPKYGWGGGGGGTAAPVAPRLVVVQHDCHSSFPFLVSMSRQHDKSRVPHALPETVLDKVLSTFDFLSDNLDDEVEGDGEEGIAADDESDIREARGKTGTVVKKKKVRRGTLLPPNTAERHTSHAITDIRG